MGDLISRAAAKKIVSLMVCVPSVKIPAEHSIDDLPAVDAVPVVRCRDCKYGDPDTNGNGEDMVMCHNKLNPVGFEDWLVPPEWFCADGEQREEAKRE